jgi:hypothetical protein
MLVSPIFFSSSPLGWRSAMSREALAIEVEARRRIGDVQAEMAQAPDLEGLRQQDAADVEFPVAALGHDGYSLNSGKSFSASAMLATQSRL